MQFHGIPWNCSCHWHWRTPCSMEFHWIPWNCSFQRNDALLIPWNCSCHRNWRTTSSSDFHATVRLSEIGALQFPWNSMKLLVSAKLAHSTFHGIPWNCSCHGTWSLQFPWNSTARVIEIGPILFPWNSMVLLVSSKLANSMEFYETAHPCNCSCHWNWRTPSSMEFHWIPWNCSFQRNDTLLSPWNCSCHRNWRTTNSSEFHRTVRVIEIGAFQVPWNSMELIVSARLVHFKFHEIPCNSMELLVSAKLAQSKFHGILWNSMELHVSANLAHSKFHGILWNSMELLTHTHTILV